MRLFKTYLLTIKPYFLHPLLVIAVLLLSSGCVRMPELNDEFEYNPSKKRELSELKKTYALFSRMEEIDVALHLSKRDFLSLVNDSFKDFSEHFIALNAGEFSHVHFGPMKFHLSNQQLVSQIEFSLRVDGLQREIFGHVMAMHRLDAASNRFVLETDFDEIVIERIDGTEVVDKNSENIRLIEKAAKNFMHTLNVEIVNVPLNIPVDLNILSGVNGKDIFFASDYKLHSAKPINMRTKMRMYLPYIYKNGVVFLGSSKIRHTSKPPKDDMDIKAMSHELRSRIDTGVQKSMGVSLAFLQEESSYYVSKAYLSGQMNCSLKDMDLRTINKFFLKIPEDEQNLSKTIYFSDKARLPSCQGVAKDCTKRQQRCNRNCSNSYGVNKCTSCDSINNPFEKVRCMSDFEACKSKEELHLYTCLKEEERCSLANMRSDKECIKENIRLIAGCEEKKERLRFADDKIELTKLHMKFNVSNSYAIQRIHKIRFEKDLSSLEIQRNLHVNVDSSLNFSLEDAGTEGMSCRLSQEAPLFVHSFADRVNGLKQAPVCTEVLPDGALIIKAKSKETPLPITLENSPYERLHVSEGPLLSCSYQNMPLDEITAEKILIRDANVNLLGVMSGKVLLRFEEEELSFRVSPAKVGKALLLYPKMQEKAIVFSPQAQFE